MNFERLKMLYASGEVKRLHVVATVREHPVAKHVYGSQLIAMELLEAEIPGCPAAIIGKVLYTLLVHDTEEISVGDIPSPIKRVPGVGEAISAKEAQFDDKWSIRYPPLSKKEATIVRASDVGDLCFSCLHERQFGNRQPELSDGTTISTSVGGIFKQAMKYLLENELPSVQSMAMYLNEEWEKTR